MGPRGTTQKGYLAEWDNKRKTLLPEQSQWKAEDVVADRVADKVEDKVESKDKVADEVADSVEEDKEDDEGYVYKI